MGREIRPTLVMLDLKDDKLQVSGKAGAGNVPNAYFYQLCSTMDRLTLYRGFS